MIKALVINTAAEYGGAITVLNSFIKEAEVSKDVDFTFLVSSNTISSNADNVHIQYRQWVKRSWFHRLFFELIYLNFVFSLDQYQSIVSLQNTLLLRRKFTQKKYILIHHPVQFYRGGFNFLKIEGIKMVFRKYLVGTIIKFSVKRANIVFAQTMWMKDEISRWITKDQIRMIEMDDKLTDVIMPTFDPKSWRNTFIYVAHAGYVKNHSFIVNTLLWMKERNLVLPTVYFTLDSNENNTAKNLFKKSSKNELPIVFTGRLPQIELFDYYRTCVAWFPSKIETFGLPLLEAKKSRTPVLAIDLPYAREVLDGYKQAHFFETMDEAALIIQQMMNGTISLDPIEEELSNQVFPSMIEIITKG